MLVQRGFTVKAITMLPLVLLLPLAGSEPKAEPKPFEKEVLQAAAEYAKWGRVDDEMRWAPYLCRQPMPGQARFSESKDEATHGQKLYSVFASKRDDYLKLKAPVGQVIVKQAWVPAEYEPGKTKLPEDAKLAEGIMADHFNRIATRDGKQYYASKPDALFIMMKLDPATAGTDDGWVYATTSADGKTVTAAGKIESCMKCHVEAKNNRLFGLGGK